MTATTTLTGGVSGDGAPPASFHGADSLLEEMNRQAAAGIPNLDNVSDGTVDYYDGPRCDECGVPIHHDAGLCEDCTDRPHDFVQDPGSRPGWCFCGRIRSIGGYSPFHDDEGEEPHPYPCPTCGGNGCRACGDTGERIEYTR